MNHKAQVICQIQVEGLHSYPDAPTQVDFLASKHRHTFKIKFAYNVTDLNREKEIFIMREEVLGYFKYTYGTPADFGSLSCEQIALGVLDLIVPDGGVWCEVWEEETGGARVEV